MQVYLFEYYLKVALHIAETLQRTSIPVGCLQSFSLSVQYGETAQSEKVRLGTFGKTQSSFNLVCEHAGDFPAVKICQLLSGLTLLKTRFQEKVHWLT